MHAHCRNGTGATGQAFCVLARGRLVWYVYHVTLVGVARSWAAMSLLARSGYVVLHALGLAFFTVAHATNSLLTHHFQRGALARHAEDEKLGSTYCSEHGALARHVEDNTVAQQTFYMTERSLGTTYYICWSRRHKVKTYVRPGCKPNPNLHKPIRFSGALARHCSRCLRLLL